MENTANNNSTSESIKQINNSSPPLPPFENIQQNEMATNEHVSIVPEEHDTRFYNRLGFYCAIDTVDDPTEKFRQLLQAQLDLASAQKTLLLEYFNAKEERYSNRIKETYEKIEEEKLKLDNYLKIKLPEAKIEAKSLFDAKTELEKKFSEKVIEFGEKKVTLIEEAIKAARINLDSIVENFQKTFEKRFGFNNQTLDISKTAVAARTRQYEILRKQAEDQWLRLIEKMQALGFDGLNPAIGHWLFYVGISIAMICGAYFFAVFALSKGISDSNLPFFLLKGLANFINQFAPNLSLSWRLLALFGCLLGFLAIITVFAWIAWVALRGLATLDGKTTSNKIDTEVNSNDSVAQFDIASEREFSFELRASGSDFLRFWLQIIPGLLVIGLVFLIVFMTLEKDKVGQFIDLDKLDVSLTGSIIGALLTLMFAGLFSIYILKIVEPRAELIDESKRNNRLGQNVELVAAIVLFTLALFMLFFLENKGSKVSSEHPEIIFTYGIFVLANGYLLGFALRVRSTFGTLHFLERKTILLARTIRNSSLPLESSLTSKEDKIFKKEFSRIQREIFNLLLLKTQLGNQALGGKNANPTPKTNSNSLSVRSTKSKEPDKQPIGVWLKTHLFFWREKSIPEIDVSEVSIQKEESHIQTLEDWENRLFPNATAEIEQLGKDLALVWARYREITELVSHLEQDKSLYCEAVHDFVRRHEDSINGFKIELERIITDKRKELKALARQSDSIQTDIRQGYNLGCWFRGTVDANTQAPYAEGSFNTISHLSNTTSSLSQNNSANNE